MKEINIPFTIFDFFAIMIPGAVGVFGIYLFLNPQLTIETHETVFSATIFSRVNNEIVWITGLLLLSYLFGHTLYGLSELLIDEPIEHRKGVLWHILGPVLREPSSHPVDNGFSVAKSITQEHMPRNMALADVFIYTASMFETLVLAMLLIAIALLRGLVTGQITFEQALISFVPVVILIPTFFVSYRRYKRMWYKLIWDAYAAWEQSREQPE